MIVISLTYQRASVVSELRSCDVDGTMNASIPATNRRPPGYQYMHVVLARRVKPSISKSAARVPSK